LTHSLKVSQLARRLAEHLREKLVEAGWGSPSLPIPECAAAAGLAHDLGHPPFGHVAEQTLDRLVKAGGNQDGFEGNAQSFRIVTCLSAHRPEYHGLDLMPRTLNAILKYPWTRGPTRSARGSKFGVYECDRAAFEAIRDSRDDRRSLEAQIMDVADDLAYGVHDLEDFWKAGLIPVDRLRDSDEDFGDFVTRWAEDPTSKVDPSQIEERTPQLRSLLRMVFPERVGRTFQERASLNRTMSVMIGDMIRVVRVTGDEEHPAVAVAEDRSIELKFLQRLTWHYVIQNPRLTTQQAGQARVIESLFEYYADATHRADLGRIPAAFVHLLEPEGDEGACTPQRLAADIVASLGDDEAAALHGRISGLRMGSILDQLHA
jgi:dGTPase